MAKFLVLARPSKPLPEGANVKRAVEHLQKLKDSGRAEIHTLVEDDGYGFAILIDVNDHDELMGILFENPLGRWGEYQVMALGTLDGERRAMEKIGVL
ncbi:MAG: hypothetical protein ACREDL_21585 [Bradyrhizobium sp.]